MIKLLIAINARIDLLKDALFALFSRSHYDLLHKTDILLICHDVDRSYSWCGAAYSPLMDSIRDKIENIGLKTLSLAMPFSRLSGSHTWSNALSINRQYAVYKLLGRFSRKLGSLDELSLWRKVLEITRPLCVIAIQPAPALSAAGKVTKVRVFDLQHGIIEPSVYYNGGLLSRYGKAGYPDGVLVWDRASEAAVQASIPGVPAIRIGNEWLQRFLSPSNSDHLVREAEDHVNKFKVGKSQVILISLQWALESAAKIAIPDCVCQALSNLHQQGWAIWIRFHPIQVKKVDISTLRYKWWTRTALSIDNLSVVDVSKFALPALLKQTTAHFTAHSATSIDALAFDVPTLLWQNDVPVRTWFNAYLKDGQIEVLLGSYEEIVNWANKRFSEKKIKSEKLISEDTHQLTCNFFRSISDLEC